MIEAAAGRSSERSPGTGLPVLSCMLAVNSRERLGQRREHELIEHYLGNCHIYIYVDYIYISICVLRKVAN